MENCLLTSLPIVFDWLPFISFVSVSLKTNKDSALLIWTANLITLSHLGILWQWSEFLHNTCPKRLNYLSPLNFQVNHSTSGFWSPSRNRRGVWCPLLSFIQDVLNSIPTLAPDSFTFFVSAKISLVLFSIFSSFFVTLFLQNEAGQEKTQKFAFQLSTD